MCSTLNYEMTILHFWNDAAIKEKPYAEVENPRIFVAENGQQSSTALLNWAYVQFGKRWIESAIYRMGDSR
uniref:Uncharacterized protein n=1 Tax=Romanomermis culicivorax TaxID=13658 RepID=A0A915IQK9_ROMCU